MNNEKNKPGLEALAGEVPPLPAKASSPALFIIHSLFIIHYSLFIIHYSLFIIQGRLRATGFLATDSEFWEVQNLF
jgi:hypothetical protein